MNMSIFVEGIFQESNWHDWMGIQWEDMTIVSSKFEVEEHSFSVDVTSRNMFKHSNQYLALSRRVPFPILEQICYEML